MKIGPWWLRRGVIEKIAEALDVPTVPIIGVWKLEEAIEYVMKGFLSTIAANQIAELLGDHICDEDSQESMRDDDRVYRTVKGLDFSSTANMINEALKEHKYWMITNIRILSPGELAPSEQKLYES